MSKKDEALKLALEALEQWESGCGTTEYLAKVEKAVPVIREALAEPIEWLTGCPECGMDGGCDCDSGTWNPPAQQEEKPTTREEILGMAREAGVFETRYNPVVYSATPETLERFASLVAAASASVEREALEKIDWTALLRQGGLVTWGDAATLADRVIAAIRARGQA